VTGDQHLYSRVFALDDISIRAGGDGRTVTAYAAVFDSPAHIADQDGEYDEQIARTAFDKTLQERAGRIGVFYNHARTLHGSPSERGSVPIGTPLEVRPDGRGLLTVTRYNRTQLADDVLESIRNGDITGQSFTGRFIKSDPKGPYLPNRSTGERTLVTRQEIALIEYGPTPIPAYSDAAIVGVRAAGDTADHGNIDAPNAADLNEAARRYAASQGWAMPDGSYPIRPADQHGRADLEAAVRAVGRGSGEHDAIRVHITQRAQAIGLSSLIPAGWPSASGGGSTSTSGRATAPGTPAAPGTGAAAQQPPTPASEPRTPHSATTQTRSPRDRMTMADERMTVEERTARQSEIRARLAEIDTDHAGATLPQDVQTEWDTLSTEYTEHERAIEAATARAEQLRALAENPEATERVITGGTAATGGASSRGGYRQAPGQIRRPEDIYDLAGARQQARSLDDLAGIYRDRALRAIETASYPGASSREDAQGRAEKLLRKADTEDGELARRMLATGSPLYNRAFGRMMSALSTNGLTAEESRALALGTDAAGGYAVPFQLDPTVILTSDGVINPLRTLARQVQIVGKKWEGVTSAGVTVSRGAEGGESPDSTPALAQPSVGTIPVQGFVPFSRELEQSWNEMAGEVTMLLQDAKDTEEAGSFLNADGTGNNPNGLITTLANSSHVAATAVGTITVRDDIDKVEEALPPRFRQRASWLATKTIYNAIRQGATGKTSLAGDLWVKLTGGQPPELSGYPAYEASEMPEIAGSGGGSNLVLILGDFQRGFLIVDRIGMSVELVPNLFGPNGRPTGQRGIHAYWSNNCKVLVDNAFRVLNVTSAT